MTIELFAALMMGLAGSLHCLGMCGGIVTAFSGSIKESNKQRQFNLSYQLGRVITYAIAGAISGYLGAEFTSKGIIEFPLLKTLSIVFLILFAFYLSGIWKVLTAFERIGQRVWKYIHPLGKRLLPLTSNRQCFLYGMVWGWLPCGLVYTALTFALTAGNAINGAIYMLLFGLGTMPMLLGIGLGTHALKDYLVRPWFKHLVAFLLLISAAWLIYQTFGPSVTHGHHNMSH